MKDNRKERTRKALLLAMVTCLQEENFDQITTSKLAKTAGISRSGFYTHYRDKYELIEYYQQGLFDRLEKVFEQHKNNEREAFYQIIRFLKEEQLLTALMGPNGTRELQTYTINKVRIFIEQVMIQRYNYGPTSNIEQEYSSVYFSYAFYGILQHWLTRGKKESPEELTHFIMNTIPIKKRD